MIYVIHIYQKGVLGNDVEFPYFRSAVMRQFESIKHDWGYYFSSATRLSNTTASDRGRSKDRAFNCPLVRGFQPYAVQRFFETGVKRVFPYTTCGTRRQTCQKTCKLK